MREAKTRNSGLSGDEYCAAENRMRKIEVHIFRVLKINSDFVLLRQSPVALQSYTDRLDYFYIHIFIVI